MTEFYLRTKCGLFFTYDTQNKNELVLVEDNSKNEAGFDDLEDIVYVLFHSFATYKYEWIIIERDGFTILNEYDSNNIDLLDRDFIYFLKKLSIDNHPLHRIFALFMRIILKHRINVNELNFSNFDFSLIYYYDDLDEIFFDDNHISIIDLRDFKFNPSVEGIDMIVDFENQCVLSLNDSSSIVFKLAVEKSYSLSYKDID